MAATAIVSGGGYKFQATSTGGTWTWTVDATNIENAGQFYQVIDIGTPYGPLVHLAVPIPADVIQAMADSISCVRQQLEAHMSLVQPATTSFSLAVTEGDAVSEIGTVTVQNDGSFGSFMNVAATATVQWLSATPTVATGLGRSDQAQFTINLSPESLLATGSPYVGYVNLQDNTSSQTVIPITVNLQVIPRPAISTSATSISFTYSQTTGILSVEYLTITNGGPVTSVLEFVVCKVIDNSAWLLFTPTSGGPLQAGESTQITFSLDPQNIPTTIGTYSETIRIYSDNASNSPVDIDVTLDVTL